MTCHPLGMAGGFDPDPLLTQHWGVHILGYDRPGYAASDPWPEGVAPSVEQWADDVATAVERDLSEAAAQASAAYSDAIGVLGWGGGGAFAIALAARLGPRVDRLAIVETPSPRRLASLAVAERDDPAIEIGDDPAALRRRQHAIDAAADQGAAGRIADARALLLRDWAAGMRGIEAEALLVHRRDPLSSGEADSRWFRRHLKRARAVLTNSDRPIIDHWHRVLEHLAPDHGEIPERLR